MGVKSWPLDSFLKKEAVNGELARGERCEEGGEKLCTETLERVSFDVENEI